MIHTKKIIPSKIVFKFRAVIGGIRSYFIEVDGKRAGLNQFKRYGDTCYLDVHSGFVDIVNARHAKCWLREHCFKTTYGDGSFNYSFGYTDEDGYLLDFNGKRCELVGVALR